MPWGVRVSLTDSSRLRGPRQARAPRAASSPAKAPWDSSATASRTARPHFSASRIMTSPSTRKRPASWRPLRSRSAFNPLISSFFALVILSIAASEIAKMHPHAKTHAKRNTNRND